MSTIEELEKRLDDLRELVFNLSDRNEQRDKTELMEQAKVSAIYSIALDLADRAGVSSEAFSKHYEVRFRWWHDYLREVEALNPSLAAELDPRSVEQAEVGKLYPSIFDPPPPGKFSDD